MTVRLLQAVLRSLADAAAPVDDGELLREFVATRAEPAFAELVRRHGRLVWAACRHLSGSEAEAEDAFQATFLVLLRNAAKVRDAGRLSSWLHGVAYRVCSKARQGQKRRAARERAAAVGEEGSAVPESAWDRALAAVHEEVARLPETLRVPFVLCCLEGRGATEAAQQLGWKLGTLSGRLTRAKDALLARLDARGLTVGVVACVALAAPPAALAKAAALAQAGAVVPAVILELARGAIGMNIGSVKLMAAAVVLACGLGVAGWFGTAGAQAPRVEVPKLDAAGVRVGSDAELFAFWVGVSRDEAPHKTAKYEYDFVEVSDMNHEKFMAFLREREGKGWEYAGTTPLMWHSGRTTAWVFRRPNAKTVAFTPDGQKLVTGSADGAVRVWDVFSGKRVEDDPKRIEMEIKRLQDKLVSLKKAAPGRLTLSLAGVPLAPADVAELLKKAAARTKRELAIPLWDGTNMVVEADAGTLEWAKTLIDRLREK